jgi:hypothetical protein
LSPSVPLTWIIGKSATASVKVKILVGRMRQALVGYTGAIFNPGFVGSTLKHKFTDLYNSKNIESIRHNTFDLVVFAASKID